MVDLVADDMKPFEVVVHPLSGPKRCLLFQPLVIAPAKFHKHHLDIALGSQGEVDVQMELAVRLKYVKAIQVTRIQERLDRVGRMLNGLIASLQPEPNDWN